MFRKLVSNLPYSPALIGQLGTYANKLRKERFARRLGLYFIIFAIILQSFVIFAPAEQTFASTGSSIIDGGIKSVQDIVATYDAGANNQNDFKDIIDYFGITRAELNNMSTKVEYICSSDQSIINLSRQHHYSAAEGELLYNIPRQTGGNTTLYSVPLYRFDVNNTNCYDSYVGHSATLGWFSIVRSNGNLQIKQQIQKFPKAHFTTASCKTIQGYAYDEQQPALKVKVYLYFNGPPGKGTQYGPIIANQNNIDSPIGDGHGFTFAVPDEYANSSTPIEVWGVMQPLPGWNQATVQFNNTVTVPVGCTIATSPTTVCSAITVNTIDRTHITVTAHSNSTQSTQIQGYQFIVNDKSGKNIYNKALASSNTTATSETIALPNAGDYVVKVILKTATGDKECAECTKNISISPVGKCMYSPTIASDDSNCKPCPYTPTLWIKAEDCTPTIAQAKEAKNLTQSITNANNTTAQPSDRIEYTIYTTNIGDTATTTTITEDLSDVLQYSQLVFNGGAIYDANAKTLTWPDVQLAAKTTDKRTFVVIINNEITGAPRGANDPSAYNCTISNSYGNTININMQCPVAKTLESTIRLLPVTGTVGNVVFSALLLTLVAYFYARSRLLNKEVRIIRKEHNAGVL